MKKEYILWALFAIFILSYLALNLEIPFVIDDYPYSRSFVGITNMLQDTDPEHLVNTPSDFFASIWNHEIAVNGRMFTAIIQQVFCGLLPKWVYDVLVTVLFALMLMLVSRADIRKTGIAVLLLFFVLCCPMVFYEGVSMTANYIIPSVIFCAMLLLLKRWWQNMEGWRLAVLILLSICLVFGHETLAVPMAGGMFVILVIEWNRLDRAQRTLLVFFIVLTAIMILSPANIMHFRVSRGGEDLSLWEMAKVHIRPILKFRILYLYLLMLALLAKRRGISGWLYDYASRNCMMLAMLAVSVLFTLFVGYTAPRVVYGSDFISMLLILGLFDEVEWLGRRVTLISLLGLAGGILFVSTLYFWERPYVRSLEYAEDQIRNSADPVCTLNIAPQDTLPPYLQNYVVAQLHPLQLEQLRWKCHKKRVDVVNGSSSAEWR